MKDIFEAIECQSATLSFQLERRAQKKGYPVHYTGYTLSPSPGVLFKVYHTLVHLPRGSWANFQPRGTPEADGKSWYIAIKRSDGIVRASFAGGLWLRPHGEDWAVHYGAEPLNADHIDMLLEDLQKPGLSGLQLAISRLWTVRFGRMPFEMSQQLETLKNVDHMDLIYDALVDQRTRKQIDNLIFNEPPLDHPPVILKYLPRE